MSENLKQDNSIENIERYWRELDPLIVIDPNFDDTPLAEQASADITELNGHLESGHNLTTEEFEMGTNLRLEWLYADHGGGELPLSSFAAAAKEAESFMTRAADHAYATHENHPQDFWAIQIKKLDLRALSAHRYAEDSQTTLKGTPDGQRLFGFSQDIMKSVLAESIGLMNDMKKYSQGSSELGSDTRGTLYELMLITYARFQSYSEQNFDTVFVRSALSREDRPWNNYVYPKRAFDIAISSPGGVELLQAKNHRNDDEYEWPIRKIEDPKFGQTLDNLPRYIRDFSLLLDNPRDPHLKVALDKAQTQLDEVFGRQLASVPVNH